MASRRSNRDDSSSSSDSSVNYADYARTGVEFLNFGINAHRESRDARRQADERQRAEEQRQQEILERANDRLNTKLQKIYTSIKPYLEIAPSLDTEFNMSIELYGSTIEDLITKQKDRYNSLDEEIKGWWMPCARSKAERINNTLKDKADSAIECLQKSLDKLEEFSSQGADNCDYTPLLQANKNYSDSKDLFEWATGEGLKAMSNKDLSKNSIARAESSIDSGLKALEQFEDILDVAKTVYLKKAIKNIYNNQKVLNLKAFFKDKIHDLKEQNSNISKKEIKTEIDILERTLTRDIVKQREKDIDENEVKFKNDIETKVHSPEDLNKPHIKLRLDSVSLPQFVKDELIEAILEGLVAQDNDARLDDKSSVVSAYTGDDLEVSSLLESDSNSGEGASVLGNNTTATNERLTEDNISLYIGILESITSLENLNSADTQNALDSIGIPNTTRDSVTREWLLSRQYEGNDQHDNFLSQFLPSRSENINSDHSIEEVTLGGVTIIDSESTIG